MTDLDKLAREYVKAHYVGGDCLSNTPHMNDYKAGALMAMERAATVAQSAADELSRKSTEADKAGDRGMMYRFNTAWHEVTAVATAIRSMFSPDLALPSPTNKER